MKRFGKKVTISYRWWRCDGKAVKPAHVEALEESAMDRIKDQMASGFTSGQLLADISTTSRDPEDGIAYMGAWEARTEEA